MAKWRCRKCWHFFIIRHQAVNWPKLSVWSCKKKCGIREPRFRLKRTGRIGQKTQEKLQVNSIESQVKWTSFNYKLFSQFRAGIHFITFTCEPSYFLPFLYKRISTAGGYIKRKRISSFDELHEFDFVINCAGIGAREIVKNDTKLKPIRGQVTRAHASWITEALLEDSDDGNYLIAKYVINICCTLSQ